MGGAAKTPPGPKGRGPFGAEDQFVLPDGAVPYLDLQIAFGLLFFFFGLFRARFWTSSGDEMHDMAWMIECRPHLPAWRCLH
jgi:hypothetical protein